MREDWRDAVLSDDAVEIHRLLAAKVDIDSRDKFGQTALMLASLHGRDAAVGVLLAKGADLNVTAKYGLSALMLAVINRREGIARSLLEAGADTTLRGTGAPGFAGKTAADLADANGQMALARKIVERDASAS